MTEIPARVEDLITTVAGTFELVTEHSWPGPDRPRVWEVRVWQEISRRAKVRGCHL